MGLLYFYTVMKWYSKNEENLNLPKKIANEAKNLAPTKKNYASRADKESKSDK
jgi:hypothetical protein